MTQEKETKANNLTKIELHLPKYRQVQFGWLCWFSLQGLICLALTVWLIYSQTFLFIVPFIFTLLAIYMLRKLHRLPKKEKRKLEDVYCVINNNSNQLYIHMFNHTEIYAIKQLKIYKFRRKGQYITLTLGTLKGDGYTILYLTPKGWKALRASLDMDKIIS